MPEVALKVFTLMFKLAAFAASAFAFVLFLTLIINGLIAGLNFGVINDLVALIQIWLPFNLGVVIAWLFTAGFTYLAFRLSVMVLNYTNEFIR